MLPILIGVVKLGFAAYRGVRLLTPVARSIGAWARTTRGVASLAGIAGAVEAVPPIVQEWNRLGIERIGEWEWGAIVAEAGMASSAAVVLAFGGPFTVPLLIGVAGVRGEVRHHIYNNPRPDTFLAAFAQVPPQLLGGWLIQRGGTKLFGSPTLRSGATDGNWRQTPAGILLNAGRSVTQELFVRECTGVGPAGGGRSTIPAFGNACAAIGDGFEEMLEAGGSFLSEYLVAPGARPPGHGDTYRLERFLRAQGLNPGGIDGVRDSETARALNTYIRQNTTGPGYPIDPAHIDEWQPSTQRMYLELMVAGQLDPVSGEPPLTVQERMQRTRAQSNLDVVQLLSERSAH